MHDRKVRTAEAGAEGEVFARPITRLTEPQASLDGLVEALQGRPWRPRKARHRQALPLARSGHRRRRANPPLAGGRIPGRNRSSPTLQGRVDSRAVA